MIGNIKINRLDIGQSFKNVAGCFAIHRTNIDRETIEQHLVGRLFRRTQLIKIGADGGRVQSRLHVAHKCGLFRLELANIGLCCGRVSVKPTVSGCRTHQVLKSYGQRWRL